MSNSSIWNIEMTLSGTTPPEPGCNGYEEVLYVSQSSGISRDLPKIV